MWLELHVCDLKIEFTYMIYLIYGNYYAHNFSSKIGFKSKVSSSRISKKVKFKPDSAFFWNEICCLGFFSYDHIVLLKKLCRGFLGSIEF